MNDTIDINIEIKDLPRDINRTLDLLRAGRGITKKEIVRDALIEYANRHKHEIK